jgi:hypothetical protein
MVVDPPLWLALVIEFGIGTAVATVVYWLLRGRFRKP